MSNGLGLDVGTAFLVSARKEGEQVITKQCRDAFFNIEASDATLGILESLGVPYIKKANTVYVVGQSALDFANMFSREARRPLHKGVISAKDRDALDMLRVVIDSVVGKPAIQGETCVYTIPGAPLNEQFDVEYHKAMLGSILQESGYTPIPMNESNCIIYSELADKKLTGLGMSFGAGMVNVCMSMLGVECMSFSVVGSGDYIDESVARALPGLTASKVAARKEKGVNILDPKDDVEKAISIYYSAVIENVLKNIAAKFNSTEKMPTFNDPVTIAVAGGTSMAGGFIEKLREIAAKTHFPFEVGEIRHAKDPFKAVSSGAMLSAIIQEKKRKG